VAMFRRLNVPGPEAALPTGVKISGALSLAFWTAVIICGRLITFYRPTRCTADRAIGFIADCIIR
jgi:hypothetical protein